MTWAFIAGAAGSSGGGHNTVIGPINTTGADLYVATSVYYNADGWFGFFDDVFGAYGNSFTTILTYLPSGWDHPQLIAYCHNPTVGTSQGLRGTGDFGGISLAAYSGSASGTVLDQSTASGVGGGTAITTQQPGSLTATNANSLYVTFANIDEGDTAVAINSSFNLRSSASYPSVLFQNNGGYLADKVSSGAENPTWSGFVTDSVSASLVTFNPASGPPPATPANTNVPTLLLMGVG